MLTSKIKKDSVAICKQPSHIFICYYFREVEVVLLQDLTSLQDLRCDQQECHL